MWASINGLYSHKVRLIQLAEVSKCSIDYVMDAVMDAVMKSLMDAVICKIGSNGVSNFG